MKFQSVLDLGIPVIVFCASCNLYYNKSNANDCKIHTKLHNKINRRNWVRILKNLYKKNEIYFYVLDKKVKSWCKVKENGNELEIKEIWYENEIYRTKIINELKKWYKNYKINVLYCQ